MGLMAYYLGIEVKKNKGIFITQEGYAKEVLKKFKMDDVNLVGTPMECGSKLRVVIRYMEAPTTTRFKVTKRIIRYIKDITNFGLHYYSSNNYEIVGYRNNYWSLDLDDRKSTTGFVFFMGDTAFT
ncbi:uncharacterized mitochondrial protein AtMg00810-like [Lathyrus oleraceus]|uniref:uncharacterized mitochondrial protein AtMg00810-like n=1 Tax=Pisum sativum TaxID=3888 RepID=UPI0021D2628E|nr:uncharacterized mitochondrial protein AtMg00810-like [Pisum sativum]